MICNFSYLSTGFLYFPLRRVDGISDIYYDSTLYTVSQLYAQVYAFSIDFDTSLTPQRRDAYLTLLSILKCLSNSKTS